MQTALENLTLHYPHSLQDNWRYRTELLKKAENNPGLQAIIRAACAEDIILWVNLFCWTKDQRKKIDTMPFVCYDAYQEEYIKEIERAIDDQEDALTDKSRDMGVSYMVLYVFTHKWLFETGSDFRVGSRKEDYVDKLNEIDTLLEKIRFNLKRQPKWLLPKGFDIEEHASYMRIINPENGNAIVGESANEHFGSGGRRKAILLDEFAKWDLNVATAAWTATADVTRCRLPVSTPVGSANKFALLSLGTDENIKKITLHWTLHPEKAKDAYYIDKETKEKIPVDFKEAFRLFQLHGPKFVRSPWYDTEAERRSEADLAQEVDIDYLRSGSPFFSATALSRQEVWGYVERSAPYDPIPYGKHITCDLVEMDGKIELREKISGWLRVFELPKAGRQYVVSGDVSEGLAKGDECYLVVRDKADRNVVAVANGLYKPTDDFDIKLYKAAKLYNNADLACENNNHGYATCQNLKDMDCNLYYTEKLNKKGEVTSSKPGWSTDTKDRRNEMLDQFEEEIRHASIELRDKVLIQQCKTFVKHAKTGKPQADGDFKDDGILSAAIGGAVIKEKPYKEPKSEAKKYKQRTLVREYQKSPVRF